MAQSSRNLVYAFILYGIYQSLLLHCFLRGLLQSWVEVDIENGRFGPVISDLILANLCGQKRWHLCQTIPYI